jgi:inosine-uridine nucleoside N-ribohydrolase
VIDGVEHSIHPASFNIPEAPRQAEKQHAVPFLIEKLMSSEEKLTVVTVGPPTNLGMAFRLEPRIKDHIEEVVFMGGGVNKGNASPVAEANFFHDPEAARSIIKSGVKCTLITLNATHSAELNLDDCPEFEALGTPEGKFTSELIKIRLEASVWLKFNDGYSDAMHDALAVAYLVDPSVITDLRRLPCDIDVSGGQSYGMLIADQRSRAEISDDVQTYVSFSASRDEFKKMLLERFA